MSEMRYRVWDTETKSFIGTDWLKIGIAPQGILNIVSYTQDGWVNRGRANQCLYQLHTGLRDSCGREIHEGDIIHIAGWRYPRQEVRFIEGAFRGHNEYVGLGYTVYEMLQTNRIDVVGNICENPELQEK